MNMGKGYGKLLKFSCKLMADYIHGHRLEISMLEIMSKLAIDGLCPNMPITYFHKECNSKCKGVLCPLVTKESGYYLVINELANCDIQTWFKHERTQKEYESVIMQLLLAIYSFHKTGYAHNDCHLGNFLIHNIKPGGYWRYQMVNGMDVYVPNYGHQLVMWDPGLVSVVNKGYNIADYTRPLRLMISIETNNYYKDMELKPMPYTFNDKVLKKLILAIELSARSEDNMFCDMISYIKRKLIPMPHIIIGEKPPDYVLNVKPYKLFKY